MLILALGGDFAVWAKTGLPLPRFASTRSALVNARVGPGRQYPLVWVFVQKGLPLQIIAEFDTWRKVADPSGASGWVHQSMLSGRQYVMTKSKTILRHKADVVSTPLAIVEPQAVARLLKSDKGWCYVRLGAYKGWMPGEALWGHEIKARAAQQ